MQRNLTQDSLKSGMAGQLPLAASRAQTDPMSRNGVTSTRSVVENPKVRAFRTVARAPVVAPVVKTTTKSVRGVTRTQSPVNNPSAAPSPATTRFHSKKTGLSYVLPLTEDDSRLLADVDDRIGRQMQRLRDREITPAQREAIHRSIQLKIRAYNRARALSARERKIQEIERRGYVQQVLGEAETTPATLLESVINPLNARWNDVRALHAMIDRGRHPLPTMKGIGKYADWDGDEIIENFTESSITKAIADWERMTVPITQLAGSKGYTGHLAGFLGGIPEGFTRMVSGTAKLASNDTTVAEKLEGGLDLVLNTPVGGWVVGKAGKALYRRFGEKAVQRAIEWLTKEGVPATEKAVRELLEKLATPRGLPGLVPEGGGFPYRTTREITPRPHPSGSVTLASGKTPKKAKGGARKTDVEMVEEELGRTHDPQSPNPIQPSRDSSAGLSFVIRPGAVPYPAPIEGLPPDRVTKELMDYLLPKEEFIPIKCNGRRQRHQ